MSKFTKNTKLHTHKTHHKIFFFRCDSQFSHLNDGRRESSVSVASSLGSYDSGSTLISDDNSAIMTRLRKSLEQKEEFMRRPSQSTGFVMDENDEEQLQQLKQQQNAEMKCDVRQREFYARPNRLQKQWPPQEFNMKMQQQNGRENDEIMRLETGLNLEYPDKTTELTMKPTNDSNSQRIKNQTTNNNNNKEVMPLQVKSTNIQQQTLQQQSAHKIANHLAREQFYNGSPQQHNQQQSDLNSLMETEENWFVV